MATRRAPRGSKAEDVAAFCRALWRGEEEVVGRLATVVDPNGRNRWGHTPLLMAAQHADEPLVALLLRRGAEVDQGRRLLTPVTLAARRGHLAIVKRLRAAGAHMSILTWTYLGEHGRVARAIAREPHLAQLRDEEDTPLLHHAAMARQPAIVTLVLDAGADVASTDPAGETALHRLANQRDQPGDDAAQIATLLLDRGADIDARNWDHVTPLHQAVRARNLTVAEVLLRRGADPNARDKGRGSTPLRRAVSGTGAGGTAGTSHLMAPLTRLLLKYGADPDLKDRRGVSVRASARDPALKTLLTGAPARPRRPTKHGRSA